MSLEVKQGKPHGSKTIDRCSREERRAEHDLDHSLAQKKDTKRTPLSIRIDEVELQFALRDFQHALTQANKILLPIDDILLETSNQIKSDDRTPQCSSVYDIPLGIPLHEYNNLMETLHHDFSKKNDSHFMVRMTMNVQKRYRPSTQERAAAIAIQCSYELWKIRSPREIDEKLCLDLSPFLKNYVGSMSMSSNSLKMAPAFVDFPTFMTFDLGTLYIHFCHAVGLYQSSVMSNLRIFSVLIHDIVPKVGSPDDHGGGGDHGVSEADFLHDEDGDQDRLYDCCRNVLDMIVVQTIPFILDIRIVESITDAIFTILRNNGSDTLALHQLDNMTVMWSTLKMSPSIEAASIKVACRNLEAILLCEEGKMSSCVRDALQDTLIDVLELLDRSVLNSDGEKNDSCKDDIRSNIESAANRLKNVAQFEKGSSDGKEGNDTGVMENIVEYLWKSEERWTNRGKVLSLGIASVFVWKRRRRVCSGAKSALNVFLSPACEIVNAIASPLK